MGDAIATMIWPRCSVTGTGAGFYWPGLRGRLSAPAAHELPPKPVVPLGRPHGAVLRGVIFALGKYGPLTARELLAKVRVDCSLPGGVHEGVAYGPSTVQRAATVQELRRALSNGLNTGLQVLERCGQQKLPGCNRWCVVYGLAQREEGGA
jgi:hypothetical protein